MNIADYFIDVEKILVEVGAIKSNDHRIVRSPRHDKETPYSSIRSGKIFTAMADDNNDDDD